MNGHAALNRIYRLVWSQRLQSWVVAAEITKGRGKSSGVVGAAAAVDDAASAAARSGGAAGWLPSPPRLRQALGLGLMAVSLSALAAPPVDTLPTGGRVVAGQAAISQGGARMDVQQTSQRAVVDWATYNVGAHAQVNYQQPGAAAVILNRVLDTQASQILGRITANGQVFLVNPNGVYFGKTASVEVGGLVAGTHDIRNDDFMAGAT